MSAYNLPLPRALWIKRRQKRQRELEVEDLVDVSEKMRARRFAAPPLTKRPV